MLLTVRELELREIRFDRVYPGEAVDLGGTSFRSKQDLRITGVARLLPGTDEITVRGRITGRLEGECDRCLETSPYAIDQEFELSYRPAPLGPAEGEIELTDEDTDVGFYEGEGLELLTVLREQILLWLPMHWVCCEECRGICPVCGANRNRGECCCRPAAVDDRWAALRDFRPSR